MVLVFIRHRVTDYKVWKQAFDAFAPTRKSNGELSYRIGTPPGEPNNLSLFFEWESVAAANRFLASPDLAGTMQKAGVCEAPEIRVTEEIASGKP